MTKIVVNRCFGGFGLSEAAMLRYAEIKGITLYPEPNSFGHKIYYTVPADQRVQQMSPDEWKAATIEQRLAHSAAYNAMTLSDSDIDRDDPTLAQVVGELGKAAEHDYAELEIVEIPDDVKWQIEEYDGKEWIAEVHRTW